MAVLVCGRFRLSPFWLWPFWMSRADHIVILIDLKNETETGKIISAAEQKCHAVRTNRSAINKQER